MAFSWFKKRKQKNLQDEGKETFFVITAIFNVAGYCSRYDLYHEFAKHMRKSRVQLLTIECIFPSLGQFEFQVTNSKNPLDVQIEANSVFWMKENLINIAVTHLPPSAKWICWLDGDIEFHDEHWVELTIKELQKYTVVQVFEKAQFLGPRPQEEILRTDYSFGYSVVHQKPFDQKRYNEWYPHPGYGWATSIETFRSIQGLPDFDIVGSGDLHFAFSLIKKVTQTIEADLHPEFKQCILLWSQNTYDKLVLISETKCHRGIVGFTPVTISHHWHGTKNDRQYVKRWSILIARQFNYSTDMIRTKTGLLEFKPEVLNSGLQEDILELFKLRKEDNIVYDERDRNVRVNKKESYTRTIYPSSSRSFDSHRFDEMNLQNLDIQELSPEYGDEHVRIPGDMEHPCPYPQSLPGDAKHPCPYPDDDSDDECRYPDTDKFHVDCGEKYLSGSDPSLGVDGRNYSTGVESCYSYADNYGDSVKCSSQY